MLSAKRAVFLSLALSIAFAAFLAFFCFRFGSEDLVISAGKVSEEALMSGRDEDRAYDDYLEFLPDKPLNINTASIEQLQKLPGLGEALSKRIYLHRQFAGPFSKPEDILQVDGISETLYAGFQHLICVEDTDENTGS